MTVRVITADVFDGLAQLENESVHCVVTSVPYFGLRDYGTGTWEGGDPACDHVEVPTPRTANSIAASKLQGGKATIQISHTMKGNCRHCGAVRIDKQIGLEPTLGDYLDKMVEVFREVRRVLRKDGTCWINIGDAFAGSWGAQGRQGSTGEMTKRSVSSARQIAAAAKRDGGTGSLNRAPGLKPKDLMMVPARLAITLQDDGWLLRQDIIWHKTNPMPETTKDRPTTAHEHVFLLTRSQRYFYDAAAIMEPVSGTANARAAKIPAGRDCAPGHHGAFHRAGRGGVNPKAAAAGFGVKANGGYSSAITEVVSARNKRSVWSIPTAPFSEAHFATMPPALAEPCILAGCPVGGSVLDPFGGAGTTGLVADRLGRDAVLIELNADYAAMAERRIARDRIERGNGTMAEVAAAGLPETPLEAWIRGGATA